MNLRLFALRSRTSRQIIPGLFFGSKHAARAMRDELNAQQPDHWRVTRGPDNWRFNQEAVK